MDDQPVIPGVPFIRGATPHPHVDAGSLVPAFAPAPPVSVTVKLPYCTYTLQPDYQPSRGNLWAPPLPFRRQPPQLNYPPGTVPKPDQGPQLDAHNNQSGISPMTPHPLA